jgi:hypothetical protein
MLPSSYEMLIAETEYKQSATDTLLMRSPQLPQEYNVSDGMV